MKKKHAVSAMESDKFDVVGNLPVELVQIIFSHLNPLDLRNALRTCKKWKNLASEEYFWKRRCKRYNYLEGIEEISGNKVCESFFQRSENYWERIFVYNEALHQNWQNFVFRKKIYDFPYVDDETPKIHYLDDKIVIMTNRTKQIFVYDYYAEKYVIFPIPHSGREDYVCKTLDFLVCTNRFDLYIIVWNINTGLCHLETKYPTREIIRKIIVEKNLAALLSFSGTCHIIDILSGKVEYEILIENSIYSLLFLEDLVALGKYKCGAINLLNLPDKTITATLVHGGAESIDSIMTSCDYLISFCSDVCIWSLQSKTLLHRIATTSGKIDDSSARFSNHRTLFLNIKMKEHDTLQAWDIVDGVCKFTIVLENRLQNSIIMNQHYIFDYSSDSIWEENRKIMKFQLWCLKTGERLTKFSIECNFKVLEATNTKLIYMIYTRADDIYSMHILDFEKEIKLEQLNALYT